jgi:hypothetical protein
MMSKCWFGAWVSYEGGCLSLAGLEDISVVQEKIGAIGMAGLSRDLAPETTLQKMTQKGIRIGRKLREVL